MEFSLAQYRVRELRDLWNRRDLIVNHEYQRAPRWTRTQQQLLIDSLLRGYPLPMFFIHRRPLPGSDTTELPFEVIDGQQRLRALVNYSENHFTLLNPATHRRGFPKFIIDAPDRTPWAGKKYGQLDWGDKARLDEFELQVAVIETDNDNEVRDLFVRLQAGSALRPQEKRDALPGGMTTFIKKLGGVTDEDDDLQPTVIGGHRFFDEFLSIASPKQTATARQVASQMVLNLMRNHAGLPLTTWNSTALDNFYHEHIDFDPEGDEAQRIWNLFDEMCLTLSGRLKSRPRPVRTEWIHLILLWQRLRDHYELGWERRLPELIAKFKERLATDKANAQLNRHAPMWTGFGMHLSGQGADSSQKIALRQEYMDNWFMKELTLVERQEDGDDAIRDPKLKDALYDRQERLCAYFDNDDICDRSPMEYDDCVLHRIVPDGSARPSNLVLVHTVCEQTIGDRHLPITSEIIQRAILESRLDL